jgi:thioester reductase-like protein
LAEFRVALDYARKVNVDGTRNILNFALLCKHLVKVNHLSTAYVVGNRGSIEFNENMLEVGQGFNNTYEQSKYESELLVREYHGKGLHISVFRPSMVVGDSREGKTNNLRLFYQPLRFFSKGYYKEFPMDLKCSMNIINVDTAAKIIYLLGFMKESNTYHVVSPMPTNNRSFTGFVYENTKIKYIKFVPIEKFDFNNWSLALKDLALPFIPYCNHRARFSSEKTQEALHPHAFLYPKMDKHNYRRILAYCKKIGFIK